ncbi:MAG: hypothetical protein A3G81_34310 [Betaproteobacteria bacterium RIFCSPLOWO2_12_FULL_65_14]|nr:MAG: hypothetical protein A3G81_34310 [Betaproteobacteria bacterium RIFCSPLOWO2_12_FULL_65_14]
MFSKKLTVVAAASAFAVLALPVHAQTTSTTTTTTTSSSTTTQAVPTAKLVAEYTDLAGSEKNAKSLVTGLRTDSKITLEPIAKGDKTISFESPTGKLGNGEVNIALAIAEKTLSGDKDVTNQDLYKALMDQKTGVLQMRADGMGWGQIANELGFKLGEVMRAGKADSSAQTVQRGGPKAEKADTLAQRPDRPVRPERVERMDKPERPMKPERPSR